MLNQKPITAPAAPARRVRPRLTHASAPPRFNATARRRSAAPAAAAARAAGASPAAAAAPLPPHLAIAGPLALKEWAVTIEALLRGDQVLLLRKGGLLDGKFRLESRDFLLFPTTFHVDSPGLLTPGAEAAAGPYKGALSMPEPKTLEGGVPVRCKAVVEEAWSTADGRVVEALAADGLHIWGPAFTEARLKWRPGAPMTLALVRAHACAGGGDEHEGEELLVRQRPEYYGCFSWTRVEPLDGSGLGAADAARWRPVLGGEEFSRRAGMVRERLRERGIEAAPLELPPSS